MRVDKFGQTVFAICELARGVRHRAPIPLGDILQYVSIYLGGEIGRQKFLQALSSATDTPPANELRKRLCQFSGHILPYSTPVAFAAFVDVFQFSKIALKFRKARATLFFAQAVLEFLQDLCCPNPELRRPR